MSHLQQEIQSQRSMNLSLVAAPIITPVESFRGIVSKNNEYILHTDLSTYAGK